jgi:hypothetical protein
LLSWQRPPDRWVELAHIEFDVESIASLEFVGGQSTGLVSAVGRPVLNPALFEIFPLSAASCVLLSALIHHAPWFPVLADIVHHSDTSKRVLSGPSQTIMSAIQRYGWDGC